MTAEEQAILDRLQSVESDLQRIQSDFYDGNFSSAIHFSKSVAALASVAAFPVTPATLSADQNNYNPQDYLVLRLAPASASRTITGFQGGSQGRFLLVMNVGSYDLSLSDESASSVAANRISSHTDASIVLPPNYCATLFYDHVISRWRVLETDLGVRSPIVRWSTCFEDGNRFLQAVGGTGAIDMPPTIATGTKLKSGATAGSYARLRWNIGSKLFAGNPRFFCDMEAETSGGILESTFLGIGTVGVTGSPHTFTDAHVGVKIIVTGAVYSLQATVADGTTETAVEMTTFTSQTAFEFFIQLISDVEARFQYRVRGTLAWSQPKYLQTNIPSSATANAIIQSSLVNTSGSLQITHSTFNYER